MSTSNTPRMTSLRAMAYALALLRAQADADVIQRLQTPAPYTQGAPRRRNRYSKHPRFRPKGFAAKRKRARKAQRRARKIARRAA